ncbi:hypothetical protein WJR50_18875 [Catalinimonas sp. 4WD22]|uniref:hypothetical protein n=1 Tax=Catalinimonas locisalis TaxID=3133978 RepID=UPI003100E3E2
MELQDGIRKLESLKSNVQLFSVDKPGYELERIVKEIINILRNIQVDSDYRHGLENDALLMEEYIKSEVKLFSNSKKGRGRQKRLNDTTSLILRDLNLIIFSLKSKLSEK